MKNIRRSNEKQNDLKRKILGKTGFEVSVCGFGSYRIDDRVPEHQKALEFAILNGVNLIDTSANYSDGHSEILIGKVLSELDRSGRINMDEIVVVSKGGYIQGSNLEHAVNRESEADPYPDVVKCAPDLWHSIHPEFLHDQISDSLKRLNLETIDVYLLHNPEYYLTYSEIENKEELRREFYERIRQAFEHLEREVEKGRISYYGVSSNSFGSFPEKRDFCSLEKMIEIADNISPDNHFAVAQLPLNLYEKGGANNRNQNDYGCTFLEIAYRNNLGVLVNRPINAIENNRLVRLADFKIKENINEIELNELINRLNSIEESIAEEHTDHLNGKTREEVLECLSSGRTILSNYSRIASVNHFLDIRRQFLVPRINHAIQNIYESKKGNPQITQILNNYAIQANVAFDSLESLLAKEKNKENEDWHEKLSEYFDASSGNLNLSGKAIHMINSLEEVSCTLVGMRKEEYVVEVINCMRLPYAKEAKKFWLSE